MKLFKKRNALVHQEPTEQPTEQPTKQPTEQPTEQTNETGNPAIYITDLDTVFSGNKEETQYINPIRPKPKSKTQIEKQKQKTKAQIKKQEKQSQYEQIEREKEQKLLKAELEESRNATNHNSLINKFPELVVRIKRRRIWRVCPNCLIQFRLKRTDQVFHDKNCRIYWSRLTQEEKLNKLKEAHDAVKYINTSR